MKHKRKCIEKRSYGTLNKVEKAIVSNYINGGNALGWYECQTCLDFHLTKKKDNRSERLKKMCRTAYLQKLCPNRFSKETIIQRANQRMMSHLGIPTVKQKRKHRKKESILPLSEQKKLYQLLQNKKPLFRWF